jgi:hypothetical protein
MDAAAMAPAATKCQTVRSPRSVTMGATVSQTRTQGEDAVGRQHLQCPAAFAHYPRHEPEALANDGPQWHICRNRRRRQIARLLRLHKCRRARGSRVGKHAALISRSKF